MCLLFWNPWNSSVSENTFWKKTTKCYAYKNKWFKDSALILHHRNLHTLVSGCRGSGFELQVGYILSSTFYLLFRLESCLRHMYFQTVAKIWVDSLQENRVKLIHSHCFVQRNFGLVVKASHLLLVEYLSCVGSGPVKVPVVSFSKECFIRCSFGWFEAKIQVWIYE